jgi:uncharacterized Fe-S cluster-containing protein
MLKINNTFINENRKFYKILDECEDYYLLVRLQDDPNSEEIQFIIVSGLNETGETIKYGTKIYNWYISHYFNSITEATKFWNALKKYY